MPERLILPLPPTQNHSHVNIARGKGEGRVRNNGATTAWTEDEIAFVRANFETMTHEQLARHLDRTEAAVRNMCYRKRWRKDPLPWRDEEDDLLRELYGQYDETGFLNAIARELGRPRTSVCARARKLGLTRQDRPHSAESVMKGMRSEARFNGTKNGRGSSTHGGRREDLGIYVRSTWEANYARYLKWLVSRGDITCWEYEPEPFAFPKIKRGTRFYIPDFRVTNPDGSVEYHEVKGYMTPRAATALKRMARYYPMVKIVLIDGPAYKEIRAKLGRLIPNWEDAPAEQAAPVWTPEKDAHLAAAWERGVHTREIADELGTTATAVQVRASRLGVRRPKDRSTWGCRRK